MAKKKRNELYYQVKKGCGLEELTFEQIGTIFLSLEKYDGTRQHFDDVAVRLVYKQLCDHIDQENGRYEDIREKRRQASHARQAVKDKQMMLDSANDNQMTSNDNTCNQMMSQKHNHKQNTESETQSESESKTESQSESTTYGGGNTAATAVERLMSNAQFMNDTSQLVMMPMKMMRDEMQKFALQLRVTNDTTTDEHEIIKGLLAWLRKGKRMNETEQAHKNNGSNERTYTPAEALDIYRRGQSLQPEGEISD